MNGAGSHHWDACLTTLGKPRVSLKSVLSSAASMVRLVDTLEKPREPTVFETPAWRLSWR